MMRPGDQNARIAIADILDEYADAEQLEALLGIVQVYRSLHPPKKFTSEFSRTLREIDAITQKVLTPRLADELFTMSPILDRLKHGE